MSVHRPPHSRLASGQAQRLSTQSSPAAQARPQSPQLSASLVASTQRSDPPTVQVIRDASQVA